MSSEITLPVGSSAEPDTCGSCKFFQRNNDGINYRMNGVCGFKLPEKAVRQVQFRELSDIVKKYDRDYTGTEEWIKDTDRCDLQRPSGKVYIVQRRISPERSG